MNAPVGSSHSWPHRTTRRLQHTRLHLDRDVVPGSQLIFPEEVGLSHLGCIWTSTPAVSHPDGV